MTDFPKDIPAGFEGFVYEPSRKQEVVAMFFHVLPELDLPLVVEEVRGSFPDCKGWIKTDGGFEEFDIEFLRIFLSI